MPYINLGGVHSHPSNYSAWLELGAHGLDTALMYGDDVQLHVGDAIKASGLAREKLFVTSKVPCCPAALTGWCSWYASEYKDLDAYTRASIDARLMGVEYVDLMLLHWPCETMNETLTAYRALEEFALAGKAKGRFFRYFWNHTIGFKIDGDYVCVRYDQTVDDAEHAIQPKGWQRCRNWDFGQTSLKDPRQVAGIKRSKRLFD